MMTTKDFADRLRTRSGARWPDGQLPEPPPRYCCDPAMAFAGWCEDQRTAVTAVIEKGKQDVAVVALRQARLALLDYWYGVRSRLPKQHLNRESNRDGDRCCYGLFLDQLDWLYGREHRLAPPPLEVRPKTERQMKAPPPQLGGIFLGQLDDGRQR